LSDLRRRILSALMVRGAQSSASAMGVDDLGAELGVARTIIETELKEMVSGGYAALIEGQGGAKVYLTGTGIITASSTYS
jgi:predicted transcriptional regulator